MRFLSRVRTGLFIGLGAIGASALWVAGKARIDARRTTDRLDPTAPIVKVDGMTFRDLNKNGRLDVYEDTRRPIEERVEDLLGQMTLEEKCGLMVQPVISAGKGGQLIEVPSPASCTPRGGCP